MKAHTERIMDSEHQAYDELADDDHGTEHGQQLDFAIHSMNDAVKSIDKAISEVDAAIINLEGSKAENYETGPICHLAGCECYSKYQAA